MAQLNNVYLIRPQVAIEVYHSTDLTIQTPKYHQGVVRQVWGLASLATIGQKVVYNAEAALATSQSGNRFDVLSEYNIVLVYSQELATY